MLDAGKRERPGDAPGTGRERVKTPRVVIVGAGFAGLWAAKGLAGRDVDVLLIDRNNYHTFVPLLYQVAAGELEAQQIAYPVRTILRRKPNVRFVMAEVVDVDLERKCVITREDRVPYDYLILAGGSVTNYFGIESVAQRAWTMKDLSEAVALRSQVLHLFERAARENDPIRRRSLLTFVVVGGGPTGVEFAATLAELVWNVLVKDFPELSFDEARVILLEAMPTLLPGFDPSLSEYARRVLEQKGVEVRLQTMVTGATDREVLLKEGPPIAAETLIWTAGVKANELAERLDAPKGRGGRLVVTPELHLQEHPEVYVAGDMAYLESEPGRPIPQVAPAAIQQGTHAAKNIVRAIAGEPLEPFCYRDPGTMVTIGRNTGVAHVFGRTVRGFLAWVAWLVVHLVKLIGFRNRLFVLANWAWNYIFFERAVRLIIKHRDDR